MYAQPFRVGDRVCTIRRVTTLPEGTCGTVIGTLGRSITEGATRRATVIGQSETPCGCLTFPRRPGYG